MKDAIEHSLEYLASDAARASLAKDPYWPKWDSPWWHVLALREAGVDPPEEAVAELVAACERHYLPYFPRSAAELPPGKTLRHHVLCFCALGCLMRVADGVATLSWADDFARRYQKSDGGWNCDEQSDVSSITSTVPMLEWLSGRDGFDEVVERGVRFLLERKLFLSKRTGAVIDEAWLTPSLPRFYEYDVLRGLELLSRRGVKAPMEAIALPWRGVRCWPLAEEAKKNHGAQTTFPLLDALAAQAPRILSGRWQSVVATLG